MISKSKCLQLLRKVFPDARFQKVHEPHGLTLWYKHGVTGEQYEVLTVRVPEAVGEFPPSLHWPVTVAAFRSLGFEATYDEKTKAVSFNSIKDFKGPETLVPVELDPTAEAPSESDLTNEAHGG